MSWVIEENEGTCYSILDNILRDKKGRKIARIFENRGGALEISLEMETNFVYTDGRVFPGWTGDENHMAEFITLEEGNGGILKYRSNRVSDCFNESGEDEISIQISKIEGQVIPLKVKRVRRKNIFQRLLSWALDIPVPAQVFKN